MPLTATKTPRRVVQGRSTSAGGTGWLRWLTIECRCTWHLLELLARESPLTDEAILTIPEVAALLRISEKSVYKLAQSGELPGFKVGNQWRFRRAELYAWIDEQRRRPGGSDVERT